MFIIRFLRFLLGYVEFTAAGGFTERFMNLCTVHGLTVWDLRRKGDTLSGSTSIQCYKQMRRPAHKAGVRLRVARRRGLPFFLHKYRSRVGLAAGLAICVLLVTVCSQFIWLVEVQGNETADTATILHAFEGLGLKAGSREKKLDLPIMEMEALEKLPQISWVSVNIHAGRAVIEVRDRVLAPKAVDKAKPCNIRASFGGQILSMEVYDGRSMVKEGDSVAEGDLLVSGVLESQVTGQTRYKHARAQITARTQRKLVARTGEQREEKEYTGKEKTRLQLTFFGLTLPLGMPGPPKGDYEGNTKQKNAVIAKKNLPISLTVQHYKEYRKVTRSRSQEQMLEDAKEKIKTMEKEQFPSSLKVESRRESVDYVNGECLYAVYYTCTEQIAQEEEIQFEGVLEE